MDLLRLILALCVIESGGNVNAVGDNELAVGILQIHPIMVEDVNRIALTRYTLADRKDKAKSIEMCKIYLKHYGGTIEEMARKWNGGPQGHKKNVTIKYWNKVKRELDKNK